MLKSLFFREYKKPFHYKKLVFQTRKKIFFVWKTVFVKNYENFVLEKYKKFLVSK